MMRQGIRERIDAGLDRIEQREPRYVCSACGWSKIGADVLLAENHLVFAHHVHRDVAREILVRDARREPLPP